MTITHLLLFCCLSAAAASPSRLEPAAGDWHTWVIPDVVSFRVPPPPDRAATEQEAQGLETVISHIDEPTRDTITYWNAGSPAYRWIQIAQDQVNNHGLGGPAATRAMSL